MYACNGVIYRPTYYQDEQVYEIVSSDEDTPKPSTQASNDSEIELSLQSPYIRGDRVRTLQNALIAIGFSVGGGADGIFGRGTDEAVRAFQDWYGLPVTGVVDTETANAIAAEYTATLAPEQPPAPAAEPATTSQETQSAPADASAGSSEEAAPAAAEPAEDAPAAEPAADAPAADAPAADAPAEPEAAAADGASDGEPAAEESSDGSTSSESSN
ncbi:peptidoglycan-binding protein [Hoeflea sp. WL0058]|uniref:Peptidoglycan-binding protein n=1 Tax=Flavimaribacter sediminis TaxID=2865987 RepID=A0AAE2ZMW6_9HYPH|nr:peptidoglycan-binding protein [Flavimaribacter sediminis]